MNEEPGKPERWYQFRHRNDKTGIFVWISLAILLAALVISVLVSHDNGCFDCGGGGEVAYRTNEEQIQDCVALHAANHNGSYPTFNGTYTNANCADCSVINISALLVANGGLLQHAPDGLNLSASGNDNCGGDASLECRNGNSYIWILATHNGTVYSYCAGARCKTNNSGYQDVWP